ARVHWILIPERDRSATVAASTSQDFTQAAALPQTATTGLHAQLTHARSSAPMEHAPIPRTTRRATTATNARPIPVLQQLAALTRPTPEPRAAVHRTRPATIPTLVTRTVCASPTMSRARRFVVQMQVRATCRKTATAPEVVRPTASSRRAPLAAVHRILFATIPMPVMRPDPVRPTTRPTAPLALTGRCATGARCAAMGP